MGTVPRPDVKIKVFPENLVYDHKLQILKKLKKTDALILNLTEDIKGNVLKKPFPFITFQRISANEQLPRDAGARCCQSALRGMGVRGWRQ